MHEKRPAFSCNLSDGYTRRQVMSVTEAALRIKRQIGFDGTLLVVLTVLLIAHAGLYYVSLHYNLPWMLVANWIMVDLDDKLALPAKVTSAIIENCLCSLYANASPLF
jgi:hypothetical protein